MLLTRWGNGPLEGALPHSDPLKLRSCHQLLSSVFLFLNNITQAVLQSKLKENLQLNTTQDVNIKTVNNVADEWRKN